MRVGPGGRLSLPPVLPGLLPRALGGQRLERGREQRKSRLPPCDSLLALGVLAPVEKVGVAMGSCWKVRPGPGQGPRHPSFPTQRLGQAAGEPSWGPQMPSDIERSNEACQWRLTEH